MGRFSGKSGVFSNSFCFCRFCPPICQPFGSSFNLLNLCEKSKNIPLCFSTFSSSFLLNDLKSDSKAKYSLKISFVSILATFSRINFFRLLSNASFFFSFLISDTISSRHELYDIVSSYSEWRNEFRVSKRAPFIHPFACLFISERF